MKKKLFQKATLRLTAVYLGVLILMSFMFSTVLFRVATAEFDRNYTHAVDFAGRIGVFPQNPAPQDVILDDRAIQRDLARQHIIDQLVQLNAVILVCGGVLSYLLARRSLEPIEEAHMSLERFTADASHELRTPLTTMRTEIEVALLNPKLSASEARKLLDSNLEEVDRLSVLSERLLSLARLDEHPLPREVVDVVSVAEKSLAAVDARADAKGIKLKLKIPKTLPLHIHGDESSLTEALVILLDNAIKYSPTGKVVALDVSTAHRGVQLAIEDKGIGIETEDLPRIFERFYRADQSRTKNTEHGYGLGLALAYKIVSLHGGKIDVASKPDKGSTFTITLPLA